MQFQFDKFKTPMALAQAGIGIGGGGGKFSVSSRGSDDGIYQNGLNALDSHHYEQALESFTTVVSRAGARAEGGLYWKAYALNKLGRRDEAQAAIDQLRKTYANSRWLDDAKALELEVKQSKGPVSPEAETDEDIKILALNSVMQSDPERALPQIENMLKTSHSPRLKRQIVTVMAMNGSPRAKQDLEQIARTGNPDLQVVAIRYLSQSQRRGVETTPANGQLFFDIYAASSDNSVKNAILDTFNSTKDKDHLIQILKTEKNPSLRQRAIGFLGEYDGQADLWQVYPSETTPEGKEQILNAMHQNGNIDKLAEVARTDKEAKVRLAAVRAIASQKAGNPSAALVAVYSAEQDPQVKQNIVSSLASARNGKALVDIARTETDYKLKLRIVEHLANMTKYSKEAADYLQEILSK
jgi:tetratricopeptide (TPR) repeat protein